MPFPGLVLVAADTELGFKEVAGTALLLFGVKSPKARSNRSSARRNTKLQPQRCKMLLVQGSDMPQKG